MVISAKPWCADNDTDRIMCSW